MLPDDLVTFSEAARRLGLSKMTFRERVQRWNLRIYYNPEDRREKLVSMAEVEHKRHEAAFGRTEQTGSAK